jgi:hypothetical protein
MSEKRHIETDTDPNPKVKIVSAEIATSKTPHYQATQVTCGKCDRTTLVVLLISDLPVEIQTLFDSIHYDSENCPRTEEAVALEHEHSPEEQVFKLQLKALIEPRKWVDGDVNACNRAEWLKSLDIKPGKKGKMGFLQDFDIMRTSPETMTELVMRSPDLKTSKVRRVPAGAMITFASFFVPESWILEASVTQ